MFNFYIFLHQYEEEVAFIILFITSETKDFAKFVLKVFGSWVFRPTGSYVLSHFAIAYNHRESMYIRHCVAGETFFI